MNIPPNLNPKKFDPRIDNPVSEPEIEAFYFGCRSKELHGHYLFDKDLRLVNSLIPAGFPVRKETLDGGLMPIGLGQDEGKGVLVYFFTDKWWTVLSFWDKSVDRRYNSTSVFMLSGKHNFRETIIITKEIFPSIWERINFEVSLYL